jgi:hypothetical protein
MKVAQVLRDAGAFHQDSATRVQLPHLDLTLSLFAGNCVQLPLALVRGAQLESQRLSLLRVVSQQQPA